MADPWSMTLAALALLGQAPKFITNWKKLIDKIRRSEKISEAERKESELELLEARSDWLFHKIILLELVIGFSVEHTVPEDILRYSRSHKTQVLEELKELEIRIKSIKS